MKRRNSFFAGIGLRASKFHIRKTLFMLLVSSLLCDFGCVENYYVMKARPCGNHIVL